MIAALPKIIHFNQDQCLFYICENDKIRIFQSPTGTKSLERRMEQQIIKFDMFYQSNLFAYVTDDKPETLRLWDDSMKRMIAVIGFKENILAVKFGKALIFVILFNKLKAFRITDLKLEIEVKTIDNPRGICTISQEIQPVICTLSEQSKCHLQILNMSKSQEEQKTRVIEAHKKAIQLMKLTDSGLKLASVSEDGILIRIFNTVTGGSDPAIIQYMALSFCGIYLSCMSNQGTLHLFSLILTKEEEILRAKLEASGKVVVPNLQPDRRYDFFSGSRCYSFSSEKMKSLGRTVLSFGNELYSLVAVSNNDTYTKFAFDPINGGELILLDQHKLD